MQLTEYLAARRTTIEGNIAVESLSGNGFKKSCEKAALAEITALECAIGNGEIRNKQTSSNKTRRPKETKEEAATSEAFGDRSKMPFGKFEGSAMEDVPANYLHWLWGNGLKQDRTSQVAGYIRNNMESLKKDHPDGIW